MQLSGIDLQEIQTREGALRTLASRSGLHFSVATLCLGNDAVAVDGIWAKCKALVEIGLPNADWVIDMDNIWPTIVEG